MLFLLNMGRDIHVSDYFWYNKRHSFISKNKLKDTHVNKGYAKGILACVECLRKTYNTMFKGHKKIKTKGTFKPHCTITT